MGTQNDWGAEDFARMEGDLNVYLEPGDRERPIGSEPSFEHLLDDGSRPLLGSALRQTILELLYDGPGVALLHGAPVLDETEAATWLWSLGLTLGQPVPQSLDGAVIGRVEDLGADYDNPTHRGHKSSAALPFHADRTDVIALLCVRDATEGGLSQLASAARVRSVLRQERPDLLAVLEQPLPTDRRGEERPGEPAWCALPIFNDVGNRIVCRYVRRFIESSQRHEDAPRLTTQQIEAMDAVDEILARPEVVVTQDLQPGQVQLIENHSIMHARTAFSGSGIGGRLLLRLWVSTSRSPGLPASFMPLYGSTDAGTIRGGVWPVSEYPLIGRPVQVVT